MSKIPKPSTSRTKKLKKKQNKSSFILYEAEVSDITSDNEENDVNYYNLKDNFINDVISESGSSIEPDILSETESQQNNNNNNISDSNSETAFFRNVKRKQTSNNSSDESNLDTFINMINSESESDVDDLYCEIIGN